MILVDIEERCNDNAVGKLATSQTLLSFLTLINSTELNIDLQRQQPVDIYINIDDDDDERIYFSVA